MLPFIDHHPSPGPESGKCKQTRKAKRSKYAPEGWVLFSVLPELRPLVEFQPYIPPAIVPGPQFFPSAAKGRPQPRYCTLKYIHYKLLRMGVPPNGKQYMCKVTQSNGLLNVVVVEITDDVKYIPVHPGTTAQMHDPYFRLGRPRVAWGAVLTAVI